MKIILKARPCPFILILSRFYLDFVLILSRFYPEIIQILSKSYSNFVLILSRFYQDFLKTHSTKSYSDFFPEFWKKSAFLSSYFLDWISISRQRNSPLEIIWTHKEQSSNFSAKWCQQIVTGKNEPCFCA